MADEIAERYLLQTLQAAEKGERPELDLGEDYRKALELVGFVRFGWEVELTELGKDILGHLRSKDDWGS